MNEDVFPVENGDFPMSFVSFQTGGVFLRALKIHRTKFKMTSLHSGEIPITYAGWKIHQPFWWFFYQEIETTPHPVTVTTRIITFLVGNPYKPSFATATGRGVDLTKKNGGFSMAIC